MRIKNLVFDVGGVLLGYRWKEMFKDHGVDEETANAIGEGIFATGEWSKFDAGLIGSDEVLKAFCSKNPQLEDNARWFFNNAILMRVLRPRVYDELKRLKNAGYKLFILSNYSKELSDIHIGDLGIKELMDGIVFSYETHTLKPYPEIYNTLIERYHLNPKETVFFDDRTENVEAAEKTGIIGVLIADQNEELLLSYLRKYT